MLSTLCSLDPAVPELLEPLYSVFANPVQTYSTLLFLNHVRSYRCW